MENLLELKTDNELKINREYHIKFLRKIYESLKK
jgi:hypothetical protein